MNAVKIKIMVSGFYVRMCNMLVYDQDRRNYIKLDITTWNCVLQCDEFKVCTDEREAC